MGNFFFNNQNKYQIKIETFYNESWDKHKKGKTIC